MDFFTDKVSVEDLDRLCNEFVDVKNQIANLEDQIKALSESKSQIQEEIIKGLESHVKDKWSIPGFNFSVKEETFPKLIKGHKEFKELEGYLKEVGGDDLYYSFATINHQSLRTLVKNLQEERPDDIIPSIDLTFKRKSINMRKAK